MYKDCKLLPELIKITYPIESEETENMLYDLFRNNLYDVDWYYKDKIVFMREQPKYHDKEESFFHIISNKHISGSSYYTIDIERAKRMLWGKAIIENEPCPNQCCPGIYVWEINYGKIKRTKLFHPKYNYLIILEERKEYWLYITSYRISNSYRRREIIAEYKKTKNAKP